MNNGLGDLERNKTNQSLNFLTKLYFCYNQSLHSIQKHRKRVHTVNVCVIILFFL